MVASRSRFGATVAGGRPRSRKHGRTLRAVPPGSCPRERTPVRSTPDSPGSSCRDRSGTRNTGRSRDYMRRASLALHRCTCRRGAGCNLRPCDNRRKRRSPCTRRVLRVGRTSRPSPSAACSCSRNRRHIRRNRSLHANPTTVYCTQWQCRRKWHYFWHTVGFARSYELPMTKAPSDDRSGPRPRHVAVIGAAGGLGQGILTVCRDEGIGFTAIVRARPERIANVPPGSRVTVVTSLADRSALTAALAGADAVLTALGVTATSQDRSASLAANMDTVAQAMSDAGVDRIVVINTLLTSLPGKPVSPLMRFFSWMPGTIGRGPENNSRW